MANRETTEATPFLGQKAAAIQQSGQLTEAQELFIELDKQKAGVKAFFEQYNQAAKAVVNELGIGAYFQDEEGIVYKTVKPSGTFVTFVDYAIDHTRRQGEVKGSLSMKEAKEAGFEVPENKPDQVQRLREINTGLENILDELKQEVSA